MNDAPQQYTALVARAGSVYLAHLNARVPHRFTGIFAIQDGMVVSTFLHDKQRKLTPQHLEPVPFGDSFCQFTIRDGEFGTTDSNADARLEGNASRGVVVSYHGVPVMNRHQELYGTLCHFDYVPYELTPQELDVLLRAAQALPPYLR